MESKIKSKDEGQEGKEQKTEEIHRISVSKSAQEALTAIVERINEGYDGGKVNRTQIANLALIRMHETLTDADVREIRVDYLDEFAYIEALVRRAKMTGSLPPELKLYMNKQLGLGDASKRRRKSLQGGPINDDITIVDIPVE